MDFSCLSSGWNEDNHEMNKNISDEKESVKNSCFAGKFDEGVNGADRSANYHEPLEASQGARIMANEVGVSHLFSFYFVKVMHSTQFCNILCYITGGLRKKNFSRLFANAQVDIIQYICRRISQN